MTDYRKMWSDLNMDLDQHDVLCEVLPGAIGEVFTHQKNRPESMDYWDMIISQVHGLRPAELVEEKKKGRKVFGTFCIYVPDEVVIAADGIVTGLCGGSQFWVPDGEKVLPTNVCPLVKASLGAFYGKTCPFFSLTDLFVGETTCDGKKKAYEIMGKDADVYVMDLPQMKREEDIQKWTREIKMFARKVEDVTGNEITFEKLQAAIKTINNRRRALARVFAARKSEVAPISGRDALLMMQIAFFDDPERCAQMANKLADELEERIKNGESAVEAGSKRILITGTPFAVPNWKLHQIIETSGAVVVGEEGCIGTRYFTNLVKEDCQNLDQQYRALAERYMSNNCACFTPNHGRVQDILAAAKEYRADGVIDFNLQFCTLYDIEKAGVAAALKEEGIPVLSLESDYSDSDTEQLKTRIGAFIETLSL